MTTPADSMEVVGSIDGGVLVTREVVAAEDGPPSAAVVPTSAMAAASAPATAREQTSGVELTKVTVFNVGKHATLHQFEKILKDNSVEYKRAKKTPSITHGTLTFETAEQRTLAMDKLGKIIGARGGEFMYAVLARHKQNTSGNDNRDHNSNNKRGAGGGEDSCRGEDGWKRPRKQTERRTAAQATASLYGVKTYAEQLAFKEKTLMDDLFLKLPLIIRNEWDKRFHTWRRNQKMNSNRLEGAARSSSTGSDKPAELRCPSWCRMFDRRDGTVPFDVLPIVPSPEPEGYRNKCEFTLSLAEDGLATAGFRSTGFQQGEPIKVESPKDCPQVHGDMKRLCVQMDSFMRTSTFPLYDDETKRGVWRFLVARRSVADKETMAVVVVNPTGVKGTDEWEKEEERLVKELSAGAQGNEGTRLVSLWLQEYAGLSSPDATSPMRLLWGKERIEEDLLGLRFAISPNSFFQVNTQGAEALYRVVIENLELGDDAVVLDVCCGAGTIGICAAAAGGAKWVYGSDLCLPAIEDARRNAKANGIENCEFVCGKAEDVVSGQIAKAYKKHKEALEVAPEAAAQTAACVVGEGERLTGSAGAAAPGDELKVAAVLDPPRSGVHSKCLRALRRTEAIKRLVYVSCNPTKSLAADARILCTPVSKSTTGMPFRPVKAIPVDMFPHTPHMELVMVFERIEHETSDVSPSPVGCTEPSPTAVAAVVEVAPAEAVATGAATTTASVASMDSSNEAVPGEVPADRPLPASPSPDTAAASAAETNTVAETA